MRLFKQRNKGREGINGIYIQIVRIDLALFSVNAFCG